MLGVLADHHDLALALDDLALFTNRLHRRPDLHVQLPPCSRFSAFAAPGDPATGQIIGR